MLKGIDIAIASSPRIGQDYLPSAGSLIDMGKCGKTSYLQAQKPSNANSDDGSVDTEEGEGNGVLKGEDNRWDAACQVCGENGDLLKCDVSQSHSLLSYDIATVSIARRAAE